MDRSTTDLASSTRREFLTRAALAGAGLASVGLACDWLPGQLRSAEGDATRLEIAPFRFDVTPPMGHSLCGGWIKPVVGVNDRLEAIGYVLRGHGDPIVICSVDWTGLLNEAHVLWRKALAKAAGTRPDRVAVQCVHQHNAPFACLGAEQLVNDAGGLPHIVDVDFFETCLKKAGDAVRQMRGKFRRVTHVASSQARVDRVASNRRVARDDAGRVLKMRGSSCTDPELIAMPEGEIDPMLKTVAFYDGEKRILCSHFYATHPMSYYGDGLVTSDFAGIARKRVQAEDPDCVHLYFTGCAGDVSAGKYNDGSKPRRAELADRMYAGIVASAKSLKPKPIAKIAWRTLDLTPVARKTLDKDDLAKKIADVSKGTVHRSRPSYMLSWLQRLEKKTPIVLSALAIDGISVLHLPAECFIRYQLRAQESQAQRFVACAAYGDGGPWYIPTAEEYSKGGYEVSVAFCDESIEATLTSSIDKLLA